MNAARQPDGPLKIRNVLAFLPGPGARGRRRVPQVIDASAIEHRNRTDATRSQSAAEVVVFTAPADEVFVEAIDPLELRPCQREITAAKGGLRVVSNQ